MNENLQRIAMGIEYHGGDYYGWQSQKDPELLTLQSSLEEAISYVADEPIKVYCAGRTDRGVHATAQVVHFDTNAVRLERDWLLGVNSRLARSLGVRWMKFVNQNFHARFSALQRRYCYVIDNRFIHPSILAKHVSWYRYALDADKMQAAAHMLLGEHDFSSFRSSVCQAPHPIRTLHHLNVYRQGDFIILDVLANAFLHHMIRNIVGLLLPIGRGERPVEWAQEVLDACDRSMGHVTAQADGLYLIQVDYPLEFNLPAGPFFPFLGGIS